VGIGRIATGACVPVIGRVFATIVWVERGADGD
jgi:hypothetical protein